MPGNRPGGGQTTKSLLIRRKVREFQYSSQHRFILLSTVLAAFVFEKIILSRAKAGRYVKLSGFSFGKDAMITLFVIRFVLFLHVSPICH